MMQSNRLIFKFWSFHSCNWNVDAHSDGSVDIVITLTCEQRLREERWFAYARKFALCFCISIVLELVPLFWPRSDVVLGGVTHALLEVYVSGEFYTEKG